MKKAIKWGLIVVGGMVVLIVAAVLILPHVIDVQKYKPVLESKVTEATGRSVSVGDDIQLSVFPWAGVSFNDLHVGNPAGFAEKDFVTIQSFDVRIKLLPLLLSGFKDIQVQRFVLKSPRVELIKSKAGKANWEFAKQAEKEPPQPTSRGDQDFVLPSVMIGNLSVVDGTASFTDHTSGSRQEVTNIELEMRNVSFDKPIDISLSAALNQHPLSVKGVLGPVGRDLKTADVPVKLNLNLLDDITIALKGQVHHPAAAPEIEARLEIAEFSLRQLFEKLEQPFPVQTADPKTLERIAVRADIKGSAAAMKLSGGELTLDDSKLAMDLEVKDFARPDLAFDIDLDQIDLDRYLPPPGEPAGEQAPSAGSSPKKTDYKPLRRLIADGRLKIGQLTVKKINARDILVQVRAQNGVIRLDPLNLSMYQGNVAGTGRVDVSGDRPQTNFDLQVQNVQVNPLMKDALNKDFLEGRTNAKVVLSMIGDDADSIKRSLNGSGDLLFNDGAIKGIDLANMVRNIKAAITLDKKNQEKPRTDFAELSVPFTIRNGVFETPSSSLKSPLVRLEAVGKADLVAETLNFRVDPKLVATIKGQGDEQERSGLMVPIAVSGSFASPKFRPDLEGAAKQQLVQDLIKSKDADEAKSAGDQLKNSAQDFLKGVLKKKE